MLFARVSVMRHVRCVCVCVCVPFVRQLAMHMSGSCIPDPVPDPIPAIYISRSLVPRPFPPPGFDFQYARRKSRADVR